ncbi:Hypothetical_protein [Hexamita inflata]|uniref:Hypothetical_protein n=1 Tax=Hexamita inflata TaxID=28002 RepID=A0AA86PHY2_9EUKA|nr:Hypothetical protein HINF_LOCUS26381 [Hexamita inflata]
MLSGLIQQAINSIQINECSLQYRFVCNYSSGIVNQIHNTIPLFQIVQVSLLGRNILNDQVSGYIASLNNASILINYINFQVCTSEQEFGESSGSVQIIGSVIKDCKDVCTNAIPTYGLCLDDLQYGSIVDYQSVCLDPFEFVNHTCICKYGYILTQSKCVNVVDSLINLDLQLLQNISYVNNTIDSNFATLDGQLASNYSQLEKELQNTKQQLALDISILRSDFVTNLQLQRVYLEHMIQNNITKEKQLYQQYFAQLKDNYINNFSLINQNIDNFHTIALNNQTENISILNNTIKSQYTSLDNQIYQKFNQIQLYLDNSQLFSNLNRINKMNQLDKYIQDNVTKFNLFQAQLQVNLSNRVDQTANYIYNNYSQLLNYIQITFANYDYLKTKCNAGSVCGGIIYYQKRDYVCPIINFTVCSESNQTIQIGANPFCTISNWYDTSSCIVPSRFTYGGSFPYTVHVDNVLICDDALIFPEIQVDLCQSRTVQKYSRFNEASWECTCV